MRDEGDYRLARGAPGVVVAKVVHSKTRRNGRRSSCTSTCRRRRRRSPPRQRSSRTKTCQSHTDGVVLARGAQGGVDFAVLLALLLRLLARGRAALQHELGVCEIRYARAGMSERRVREVNMRKHRFESSGGERRTVFTLAVARPARALFSSILRLECLVLHAGHG